MAGGLINFRFGGFNVLYLILLLGVRTTWCKECTNIPPQLQSHTYRYALLSSNNETWKQEIYSSYYGHGHAYGHDEDHLIPSDDSAWSSLLPQRGLKEAQDSAASSINAKEELSWTILYRKLRYSRKLSADSPRSEKHNFLREVPLNSVRLDPDSLHGKAQHTNSKFLLLLDLDNLVWNFRETAGLPAPGNAYGGWESNSSELRGHFVGHYMSATAKTWASTGDDAVRQKMTAVVTALNECQKAMGTGYLSAFPSEFFDRFEAIKPVWAPYYTIHKIMTGLLDQFEFAGNAQAFNMTEWMAEYFYNRVQNVISKYTIERHWYSLNEEVGGMNDVLYRLYTLSGNQKHLELAHLFDKPCFLGMLAVQADSISGFHANTHIPVVIGSQMRYEVTGDPLYKEIGTFFMDIVNSSHAYATGGTSVSEFWSDPKRLASTLGRENEESCTTYNMLKVARHLFRWTKAMAYADYYERALTNGVLSIQRGSEPGIMIYMLPQAPGSSKAVTYHGWGTKYDSFWCCYGTATESFSKLGDSIYFQEEGTSPSLYVIQFISSTLTWDAAGLTLKQVVQPLSSWDPNLHVSMEFSTFKAAKSENELSSVNIRIPFWTDRGSAQAMLNGENLSLPDPGNFLTVTKKWISGDKLSLTFPVSLRTESIKDDRPQFQSVQAILFGPYLLAGMTDGEWDLNIGNKTSFSDWITSVPPDFASQLFTFSQERKISGSNESTNNTLVITYNNGSKSIIMDSFPEKGTDEAAHATFRIVDSDVETSRKKKRNSDSAMDFVGKKVYLELFDHPGMVIAHQGINNNLTVSQHGEISLADKDQCSMRPCMAQSVDRATIFKVRPGLDGNSNSLSFESVNLPSCFLYGGTSYQTGQAVQLQCKPKKRDLDFSHAVSYNANTGLSAYHPISFIATGSKRSYLLAPLLAFRDESYTVYFHITT